MASVARPGLKEDLPLLDPPQGDVAVPNINGQKHVSHSIPAPDRDRSFLAPLYRNGRGLQPAAPSSALVLDLLLEHLQLPQVDTDSPLSSSRSWTLPDIVFQ